ncbi:MAG: hypothetical protein ACP5IO_01260 [Elusimicrobiales bacterium]
MKKTTKIAAGAITAAIVACAIYFLSGERGKKNRERIKNFSLEIKREVLERMKALKEITKQDYIRIVDEIADKYKRLKKVSEKELLKIIKSIKDGWKHIEREISK